MNELEKSAQQADIRLRTLLEIKDIARDLIQAWDQGSVYARHRIDLLRLALEKFDSGVTGGYHEY